ncbi:MAG: GNAT family N-acetyltransferase [Pseudomonadota bacterium]
MIEIHDIPEDDRTLGERLAELLDADATSKGHPYTGTYFGLAAWDGENFAGGAQYQLLYGWCFLKQLAVDTTYRGAQVGSRLLEALETRMRANGALGIWLDTFGYQAAPFYRRHGFEEFGRLAGSVSEEDRIFLRETLGAEI